MPAQIIEALPKDPSNTYLIVILALFIAEKVINMSLRAVTFLRNKNGKGRENDTKILPRLENPTFSHSWETHKTECHDTRESSKRMEASLSILKRESLLQTVEIKKQTKAIEASNLLLAKIAKNGSK